MRRRDLIAGAGSLAVLGGAGALSVLGRGSLDDALAEAGSAASGGSSEEGGGGTDEPTRVRLDTIDAPGSSDGEMTLPAPGEPTFLDFFGTWCPPCEEQMPALAAAHERVGDEVAFVSVTTEAVGRSVTEAEVVEWWETNGGNWPVAVDLQAELAAAYLQGGYPSAVAVDANGRVTWGERGVKTADELVAGIETALGADE